MGGWAIFLKGIARKRPQQIIPKASSKPPKHHKTEGRHQQNIKPSKDFEIILNNFSKHLQKIPTTAESITKYSSKAVDTTAIVWCLALGIIWHLVTSEGSFIWSTEGEYETPKDTLNEVPKEDTKWDDGWVYRRIEASGEQLWRRIEASGEWLWRRIEASGERLWQRIEASGDQLWWRFEALREWLCRRIEASENWLHRKILSVVEAWLSEETVPLIQLLIAIPPKTEWLIRWLSKKKYMKSHKRLEEKNLGKKMQDAWSSSRNASAQLEECMLHITILKQKSTYKSFLSKFLLLCHLNLRQTHP